MDEAIVGTLGHFIKLVREKYDGLKTIYIFGSYVKERPTEDSDIDIALVFENLNSSERFDFQVQLMLLAAQIDTRIEPHPISFEDFSSGNPFAEEIKRTGLELKEIVS